MSLNKSFAEILKQKITIGSTRSILLNALPGRLATRLPLSDIDYIEKNLSVEFIHNLISKTNFEIKFNIDLTEKDDDSIKHLTKIQKRLNAIKYEHDDFLKEHGVETFGFGFPLFLRRNKKDPSKFIVAPIFIFPLEIKQTFDKTRQWTISRSNDSEVRLNEVFTSYIESEEHIKIPSISDEMLEDGILDNNEIEAFCKELLSKFDNSHETKVLWDELQPIPDKLTSDDTLLKHTTVLWSGVFGLYKAQKQSQINEMEALLESYEEIADRNADFEWNDNHSPEITDPSQNLALRSLAANRDIVIQGPPGTGKSQTLTAIISSALANNKKVLVVCEKRTALEVLKNNLEKLIPELSNSIALVEDVSRDRTRIVEIVRNRTARYLASQHLKTILSDDILRFETKAHFLEEQYKSLRQPIWRNLTWKNLVTLWISQERTDEDIALYYELQRLFQESKLSDADYSLTIGKIEDGSYLFRKIQGSYHKYESLLKIPAQLNSNYEKDLIFNLKDAIARLDKIDQELSLIKTAYENYSSNNNLALIKKCYEDVNELIDLRDKWLNDRVDLFNITVVIRFKAIFSNKFKLTLIDEKRAKELLQSIEAFFQNVPGKDFSKIDLSGTKTFLENDAYPILSKQAENKLTSETNLNTIIGFQSDSYSRLFNEATEILSKLAKFITLNNTLAITKAFTNIQESITEIVGKLKFILKQEQEIKDYFTCKIFECTLKENDLKWIKSLMNYDAGQWKDIVTQTWLYFKLLNEDDNKFPTDESTIEVLKALRLDIQKHQKEIIRINLEHWFQLGQKKIKERGLLINQVYNLRGSKGTTRNSLRKIIHMSLESFTDFFPIVMLNPSTCSSIIPLKKEFFDIVIFDEASQLRIEDTYPSILRGKQVIVSGDSQQMPPSSYFESTAQILDDDSLEEDDFVDNPLNQNIEQRLTAEMQNDNSKEMAMTESLLQFAIDSEFRQTYLDMHYRSKHPDLIMFSNTCFYNSRLVPMPEQSNKPPIIFRRVDGMYDNRQNIDEAKEIVRILKNDLDCSLSVGIATFNLNQRNLILDYINDERVADEEFRQKMDELEKLGFFVKNLENIQGDERDIILISTTFGCKKDNSFRLSFGPISQKNGHRLLNVIITRAKHKVYVLTSIPEAKINEYRQRLEINHNVDGTTGLLAYLAYSKAVSNGTQDEKENILSFIKNKIAIGQTDRTGDYLGLTESPFEEEIASWLHEFIDKERIVLQYKCGGFRIDMVVLPKNSESNQKLAIECDGAAYHSDEISWHHDIYRQQQLEEHGFVFHRIWSTNWWRKPEEEFQNLLIAIDNIN